MGTSRRRNRMRVEPTHEWEQLVPLFEWPEQEIGLKADYPVLNLSEIATIVYVPLAEGRGSEERRTEATERRIYRPKTPGSTAYPEAKAVRGQ